MQDENYIISERQSKLAAWREAGIDPYPAKAERTYTNEEILDKFADLTGTEVTVVGRLMAIRAHGKLTFMQLEDGSAEIQLSFKQDDLGKDKYKLIRKFDVGDFVEITGEPFTTDRGQKTIGVKSYKILTKSVRPLPEKWHGLKDEEKRYRRRHLDLLFNKDLKDVFVKKSIFWNTMRDFLQERGFLEVETPVLENITGGADANPFITHHDALDLDVYLRISTGELWQKRLMAAGYERTFEIGRQFRNEGISPEHLQDYTQMECYWAYADYKDMMKLVEELYRDVAQATFGKHRFKIREFDVDLGKDWERIEYVKEIEKQQGLNVLESSREDIMKKLDELKEEYDEKLGKWRLVDQLWKHCRKNIGGPAFVINPPVAISPLAKRLDPDSELGQRFWVLLGGTENGNGYSELNDPKDQADRFAEQAKLREAGDKEAQMHDRDFVEAMEYGMPPVAGFGVSERLFSFLLNKSVREMVLFPLLKPEDKAKEIKKKN
ncbi:lysine--tRNA ligase [Patescibacteria group bacterium]